MTPPSAVAVGEGDPVETLQARRSITSDDLAHEKPSWNYEDIGVFFLVLVLIGSILRLFVRLHLLSRSELNDPSVPLQFALLSSLSLALYLVLKVRYHRPVLRQFRLVMAPPGLCCCWSDRGHVPGLGRCVLSSVSQSKHAANRAYGAAASGGFAVSNS